MACACGNHDTTWLCSGLQPRCQIGCLAHHGTLLCGSCTDEITDNDQAGRDTHTDTERVGWLKRGDGIYERESRPHCLLCVLLVCGGIPKINQDTVAHKFGDVTTKPCDRMCYAAVIGTNHVAQILRIEARGERGRADQVAEHDG